MLHSQLTERMISDEVDGFVLALLVVVDGKAVSTDVAAFFAVERDGHDAPFYGRFDASVLAVHVGRECDERVAFDAHIAASLVVRIDHAEGFTILDVIHVRVVDIEF